MSWNGVIMKFPKGVLMKDLPDDWKAPVLMGASDIRKAIAQSLTCIDNQPGYAMVETNDTWVEIKYEPEGDINSVSVRTNAHLSSMELLENLCHCLEASLFDNQTGEIADFKEETKKSMENYVEWYGLSDSPNDI